MVDGEARLSAGKAMIKVSDDYLYGFVEGEGCFYASFVPARETASGWQVIHFFKVSQNPRGIEVLEALKERLQCGYIKRNASIKSTDKSMAYVVRSIYDLREKVVPYFQGKLVIKRDDFDKFSKIVDLVFHKTHLTRDGVRKIISITKTMNSGKRKYAANTILKCYS